MRDSDIAYNAILELIIKGLLKSGEIINEKMIVDTINVGRTPTREALTRLGQEGFINTMPGKGMFISSFDFNDLKHLFEFRRELYGFLSKLLIERITDDEIQQLEDFLKINDSEDLIANKEKNSKFQYIQVMDIEFHELLNSFTGNRYLIETMRKLQILTTLIINSNAKSITVNTKNLENEYK